MENDSYPEDTEFMKIADSSLYKLNSAISKVGYSDGISEGRDSAFQNGFDFGYKDGFKVGFGIGKYKSFAKVFVKLNNLACQSIGTESKILLTDENIKKVDHKNDMLAGDRNLSLEQISAKQNEFIDQKLEKLKSKYPNLCNLLD